MGTMRRSRMEGLSWAWRTVEIGGEGVSLIVLDSADFQLAQELVRLRNRLRLKILDLWLALVEWVEIGG